MSMKFQFKEAYSLEERKQEYQKVVQEHPGKIGIICEKAPKSPIEEIKKTKYLVGEEIKLGQFSEIIRKKIKMEKQSAIFLLANGKISLTGDETMSDIYKKYKDEDGFLYIAYASEEVWGKI